MKKVAIVALIALLAVLSGCRSSNSNQMLQAAQLVMRQESQNGMNEEWDVWGASLTWDAGLEVVAEVDDTRMPDWARDEYDACVHWSEAFTQSSINQNRQPGDPLERKRQGKADGWILLTRNLDSHILELNLEFNGESITWIDNWDPPASSQ